MDWLTTDCAPCRREAASVRCGNECAQVIKRDPVQHRCICSTVEYYPLIFSSGEYGSYKKKNGTYMPSVQVRALRWGDGNLERNLSF